MPIFTGCVYFYDTGPTPDNLDRHFWLPSNPAIKECISNLLVMKIKWRLDINTGAVERSEAARVRRLAGATVVGPVTARADQLWHAETGPPCARTTIPNRTIITSALSWGCWSGGPISLPDQNNGDSTLPLESRRQVVQYLLIFCL